MLATDFCQGAAEAAKHVDAVASPTPQHAARSPWLDHVDKRRWPAASRTLWV